MPSNPAHEHKTPKPLDEQADFVISDVDGSAQERAPFEDIWEETEENFLVRPFSEVSSSSTQFPLASGRNQPYSDYATLKDPATHSAVMSIVSSIALALFPEPGFVTASRVGFEDILKARVTSKLIEYVFSMPHHFLAFVEWLMSGGIYGTGWLEGGWEYSEMPQTVRSMSVDPIYGDVQSTFEIMNLPEYDDIKFRHLSVWDVYPACGTKSPMNMQGITKHFRMTARQAEKMAENDTFDREAVQRAIEARRGEVREWAESRVGDDTALSVNRKLHPDFMELDGFERFGEVPFKSDDGFDRRVITVLGGETVRSDPWPRKLPIFPLNIIPRHGSPYGISPAEIIRYDQDLADVLKMMIADAVVRGTHAPQIYEEGANVDLQALRSFKLDRPVRADRTDAVRQIDYRPPVDGAMGMYGMVRQHIHSGSSVEGAFAGQEGPDRESATGFAGRLRQAGQRPELFNVICERVWLPPVGTFTLKLYQEMLEDDQALKDRVGESEGTAVQLADILAEFDVRFVGTRIEGSKQQELQAFREIVAAGNHPVIGQLTPWMPLIRKYFERIGAPELAAMVGNPELMQMNVLLNRIAMPNEANGNGANPGKATQNPSGQLAQSQGGALL